MAEEAINEVIKFLKEQFASANVNVKHIAMFGSHLRHDANDDSDLDVIIISDDFEKKDIFQRSRMSGNANWNTIKKFMIPLDVLYMTPKEFAKLQSAKRFEAKVVA